MLSNDKKDFPPPDYQEVHQQPYNPEYNPADPDFSGNRDELANLTSNYEEEEHGLFGGVSLFYFLVYSGFSTLLPFLSIIFYHHGYSISQIGTIYTVSFFISCASSCIWNLITKRSTNKHSIMLLSVISWIIGFAPLMFIKHHDPITHCVASQNETNNSTTDIITAHRRWSNHLTSQSGFEAWKKWDFHFIVLLSIFSVSRILQSGTDYFYFDHPKLMYPEIVKKLTITSYHVSTKISAAVITVFVGFMLDSILFCNTSLGHFQIAFYLFMVFMSFAVFVLYFLNVEYFQKPQNSISEDSCEHTVSCPFLLKSILMGGFIVMGASRGVNYAFLNIRLSTLNALYLQIGAAFAIHKITETSLRLARKHFFTSFGVLEISILVLCMEGIRNVYYGYITTRLMIWFILPIELLSGFPAILLMNFSNAKNKNNLVSERLFTASYWWIGFSFGPILFGFGYEAWSAKYMFRGLGVTNLVFALVVSLSYFACLNTVRKDRDKDDNVPLIGQNEETEIEFLIQNDGE